MTKADFQTFYDELGQKERELLVNKGDDYTRGDLDVLVNFKSIASGAAISPKKVFFVLMQKHWDVLRRWVISEGDLKAEPIEDKIRDLRLYLALLLAFIDEIKDEPRKGPEEPSKGPIEPPEPDPETTPRIQKLNQSVMKLFTLPKS